MKDSDYAASTFKMVVEHTHGLVLARGRLRREAKTVLDILLTLVEKASLPVIDAAWINGLLRSAAKGEMGDDAFTSLLRLSAQRTEGGSAEVAEMESSQDYVPNLFIRILRNVQICSEEDGGWEDEAVYGGLVAMRDVCQLGDFFPTRGFLRTLSGAMEGSRPSHIREAAYDVILVARDGWLKFAGLRRDLMDLDVPRRLHGVATDIAGPDHQDSFLMMMEMLSEDGDWHSYLRGAMDIWLPFRHERPDQVLRILTRVGELQLPEGSGSNTPPPGEFLAKLVEHEWARVPGRPVEDLTADRLRPLAEVTTWLNGLLLTDGERREIRSAVEQVIPSLERRRDGGYRGPGEDIYDMVDDLVGALWVPLQ